MTDFLGNPDIQIPEGHIRAHNFLESLQTSGGKIVDSHKVLIDWNINGNAVEVSCSGPEENLNAAFQEVDFLALEHQSTSNLETVRFSDAVTGSVNVVKKYNFD